MGLAVRDVVGGDQFFRQGKAGGSDADFGKGASAGGHDGPAIIRQAGEQIERAGQRDDAAKVFDFATFNLAIFSLVIGVRQVFAHGGKAGAAMSVGNDFFRIESVLDGPAAPDARHGGSGVDEDSVHIEQESGAVDLGG